MTDVAALGFAIDSSSAVRASSDLDKMSASAAKADQAAKAIGSSSTAAGASFRSASTAAADLTQKLTAHNAAAGMGSTQAQALFHSVRSMAEGLAAGASPTQILAQQISHLSYAASGEGGLTGALSSVASRLIGLVSPAAAAVTGLAAVGATGVLAYTEWRETQEIVTNALAGIGRASGATADDINAIGAASANAAHLSVAAATEIAASFAQTGTISKGLFSDAVESTRGLAKVMGTDASTAAALLAKALTDPVKGAEELNQRLGFLDYNTQNLIKSLVAQNNTFAAQKIILDGVKQSTAGAADTAGFFSRVWTSVKNSVSDAGSVIGEVIDKVTGGGTLQQQYASATQRVLGLKAALDALSKAGNIPDDYMKALAEDLRLSQTRADGLRASLDAVAAASETAATAAKSRQLGPVVSSFIPEVEIRKALSAVSLAVGSVDTDPAMLKALGLTQADVDLAKRRAQALAESFLTTIQKTIAASDIQLKAVTARSPAERASIAYQQTMLQLAGENVSATEKQEIATKAAGVAAAQVQNALNEAARERIRSAQDAVGEMQVEIASIGQTAGATALLKANWRSYADLRAEADRNHTSFDNAQYQRLVKINQQYAEQAQLLARAQINADIKFGAATSLLSPDDVQIAEKLKSIYPDVSTALSSVEASGLRTNQALSGLSSSISGNLVTGLSDAISGTKSFGAAMADTSRLVIRSIEEMIVRLLVVGPLMRGLQSVFGFAGGGPVTSGTGFSLTTTGGLYASGGPIRGPGSGTSDSIPAMLSNGEFVVNAAAASRFGPLLEAINSGVAHFAAGGMAPGGECGPELSFGSR